MARKVDEWVGKDDNAAVPERVLERLLIKQDWKCKCGLSLRDQAFHRDHIIALINWVKSHPGDHGNRESNLQLLGVKCCHRPKTKEDMRIKHRTSRKVRKHAGIKNERRPVMAGTKRSNMKKCVDGRVIDRRTGREWGK